MTITYPGGEHRIAKPVEGREDLRVWGGLGI
jgi:hypothetical protein